MDLFKLYGGETLSHENAGASMNNSRGIQDMLNELEGEDAVFTAENAYRGVICAVGAISACEKMLDTCKKVDGEMALGEFTKESAVNLIADIENFKKDANVPDYFVPSKLDGLTKENADYPEVTGKLAREGAGELVKVVMDSSMKVIRNVIAWLKKEGVKLGTNLLNVENDAKKIAETCETLDPALPKEAAEKLDPSKLHSKLAVLDGNQGTIKDLISKAGDANGVVDDIVDSFLSAVTSDGNFFELISKKSGTDYKGILKDEDIKGADSWLPVSLSGDKLTLLALYKAESGKEDSKDSLKIVTAATKNEDSFKKVTPLPLADIKTYASGLESAAKKQKTYIKEASKLISSLEKNVQNLDEGDKDALKLVRKELSLVTGCVTKGLMGMTSLSRDIKAVLVYNVSLYNKKEK